MRRLAAGVVALVAAAGIGTAVSGLSIGEPDPLPVLRNSEQWQHAPPFARASLGGELIGPVSDAMWLTAGSVPGSGARQRLVSRALLDLRGLTRPSGAVAAGPDGPWAYTWPRDTAFVASAYAVSGHPDDAWRALRFLSRVQLPDGGFEARYRLDGSGPPDGRPRQTDGAGWVLWSLDEVRSAAGTSDDTDSATIPPDLRPLRDRAVRFVLAETQDGRALPPASPDYWEVDERRVTLGTAAPLAAGLEAASRTYAAEGNSRAAQRSVAASVRLRTLIRDEFGPTYERHGSSGGLDAGVTMLMPPFAHLGDRAARTAWERYPVLALQQAGGIAPGADWKHDGVSWTPETAMVAYTAAASGHVDVAERWLGWLDTHCTTWGSLPEKVLPDGSPAGPAPLAWTSALVVLTEHELSARRATVGELVVRPVSRRDVRQ
ncbi:glycoside hydrolase family 15 protein [Intrasporangium oryzae]|uniref:glycoside hydrolase family 15 n=1 Tax=Intrasporangium oryzae TaxID=412687 RepID=UPI000686F82A|nr:glycoside hydrolase family 15 [Intrasporangium oryzae]